MRVITKPILGIAAAIVCSVAAAPASGHKFIVERKGVSESEVFKVSGTSGPLVLKFKILLVNTVIECKKDTFEFSIDGKNKFAGKITFEECSVTAGFFHCTVPNVHFSYHSELVGPSPGVEAEFDPAAGTLLFEFAIEGSECVAKDKYKAEGKQTCKLPSIEMELREHEIDCTPAGSAFSVNKEPATMETLEKGKLELGKEWSAI